MMCTAIAKDFFSSKKLQAGYTVTFQKDIALDFEYILDSHNFLEW